MSVLDVQQAPGAVSDRACPDVVYTIAPDLWEAMTAEELAETVGGLKAMELYHRPWAHFTVRLPGTVLSDLRGVAAAKDAFIDFDFLEDGTYRQFLGRRTCYPNASAAEKADLVKSESEHFEEARQRALSIDDSSTDDEFGFGENYIWWEADCLYSRVAWDRSGVDDGFSRTVEAALISLLATRNVEKIEQPITSPKISKLHKLGIGKHRPELPAPPHSREIILHCPVPLYEPNDDGSGAKRKSPKLHRRSGHRRRQHYGAGNAQVKDIWIEPVMVMSNKAPEGTPLDPRRYRLAT